MNFSTSTIEDFERATSGEIDALPFGVIGLDSEGRVEIYSATESRLAGLSSDRVLGRHFFSAVAPCMNNYMVAQRFEDEAEFDATIDYVLTLRMKPTPVKLRILKSMAALRRYILVQR